MSSKTPFNFWFLTAIFTLHTLTAQVASIPFEIKNDIILIKLQLNDDNELRTFIFDTGATADVLDQTMAERMGLESNYQQEVPGAGGSQVYDIILGQQMTFANSIQLQNINFVLVDLHRLRDKLERDFEGIVGYSLIQEFVVVIDYESQELQLFERIEQVNTDGYQSLQFTFDNGIPIPQFEVGITLDNEKWYNGKIFFDSGAALSLSVNTPFNEKHQLDDQVGKQLISESENLGSKSISTDVAIKGMKFGPFELGEMVISIANDTEGVSSYPGYLGILGGEVISRFDVILDYSEMTLYLKPNERFSRPFEFPLSGISLKQQNDKILVYRVQSESPAYKKGLRAGDHIVSINSDYSGNLETYRELLKQEGETCTLKFSDNNGQIKEIEIKLERLL